MLLLKDQEMSTRASNFRPIACLPIAHKLPTGMMPQAIYEQLDSVSHTGVRGP